MATVGRPVVNPLVAVDDAPAGPEGFAWSGRRLKCGKLPCFRLTVESSADGDIGGDVATWCVCVCVCECVCVCVCVCPTTKVSVGNFQLRDESGWS